MLDAGEEETKTGGRGLYKLKLASRMGKGQSEIVKAVRNVVRGADGCAQDNQAIMKDGTATEGARGPLKLRLNNWGKGMKEDRWWRGEYCICRS